MNTFALWFRWVVFAGILQDWFVALPGLFVPSAVLELAETSPAIDPTWVAFASLNLVLLSLFYIPGAVDPFRYSALAGLTVIARLAGVVLFFVVYPGVFPPAFGYIDLVLTIVQGTLLALALYVGPIES